MSSIKTKKNKRPQQPTKNKSKASSKPPASLNDEKWISSGAKDFVSQCFIDGILPLEQAELKELDLKDIYDNLFQRRREFKNFPFRSDLYAARLESIRNAVANTQSWAAFDEMALERDRNIFPCRTHNSKGEINWKGSEADYWLKVDMEAEKHLHMKPSQLREQRNCYKLFSKERFRKRIDQLKEAAKEYGCTPGQNKSKRRQNRRKLGNQKVSMLNANESDASSEEAEEEEEE